LGWLFVALDGWLWLWMSVLAFVMIRSYDGDIVVLYSCSDSV
jgi:hypothetical protein